MRADAAFSAKCRQIAVARVQWQKQQQQCNVREMTPQQMSSSPTVGAVGEGAWSRFGQRVGDWCAAGECRSIGKLKQSDQNLPHIEQQCTCTEDCARRAHVTCVTLKSRDVLKCWELQTDGEW